MQNETYQGGINGRMKNAFAAIVSYYDNHPGYVRLASFYGIYQPLSTPGKGLGSMRNFASNPEDGCWAVWRNVSASVQYDVAVIASDVYGIGTYGSYTTGSWQGESALGSGVGIHIVAAYNASGAWNGTTASNGLDTFVTPWKSGSQTTIRCNGPGGGNASTREAAGRMTDTQNHFVAVNKAYNIFITGDNDTTYLAIQKSGTGADIWSDFFNVTAIGLYQPASSSYNVPLTQFKFGSDNVDGYRSQPVGSTTSNSGGGGICTASGSSGTKVLRVEYPSFMLTDDNLFSRTLEEDKFWEFPIKLYQFETGSVGYVGTLPDMRVAAASSGIGYRFYRQKTKLLVSVRTPNDPYGGDWLSVSLPWNSSVLIPQEW
jgi:hypothetical protein